MFQLDEKQGIKFNEWYDEHSRVCKVKYCGAAGGRFTYMFTPTGLGIVTEIKCACGEVLNLTDYDVW